jgi:hypothetical protein
MVLRRASLQAASQIRGYLFDGESDGTHGSIIEPLWNRI